MPRATPRPTGRARLVVTVTVPDGGRALTRGLGVWLTSAAPLEARGEVTIALVSDGRMRTLNRSFRNKDYATDVLSFSNESHPRSVSEKYEHAPSRRTPSAKNGRNSRLVPREARLLGARAPLLTRAPSSNVHAGSNPGGRNVGRRGGRDFSGGGGRGFSPAASDPHLGDIVIATGVANRQADEAGHSLQTELRVLALHGLLHLLGYDHDGDDGRMARIEAQLRRKAGLREGLIERGGTTSTPTRQSRQRPGPGMTARLPRQKRNQVPRSKRRSPKPPS